MLRYREMSDTKSLAGVLDVVADITLPKGRDKIGVAPGWATMAALNGSEAAMTFLAGLSLGASRAGEGQEKARSLLLAAAEKGYAPAQLRLGCMALLGLGAPVDEHGAAKWLGQAADQHAREAQTLLGLMYAAGFGVERDLRSAKDLLERAAEQGEQLAKGCRLSRPGDELRLAGAVMIPMLQLFARIFSRLPDHAGYVDIVHGVLEVAAQGDAVAQLLLSTLYENGDGVDLDATEALRWRVLAAEAGHPLAMVILGYACFADGAIEPSELEAARWLQAGADQEDMDCQFGLGLAYHTGRGVKQNDIESVLWVRRAAEQGQILGQYCLGISYGLGRGVEQDHAEAVHWFQAAAKQGNADSQYFLGAAYELGQGIEQNQAEAVRWYQAAAEQGNVDAQYFLAQLTDDLSERLAVYAPSDRQHALAFLDAAEAFVTEHGAPSPDSALGRLVAQGLLEVETDNPFTRQMPDFQLAASGKKATDSATTKDDT
jgi:TPR repeat protein